jgi:tRNA threonylcarbamoyladenosine biosynthesis protein TsaB
VPLYTVSSLALIVAGNVTDGPRGPRRYVAVLDALRGESYVSEFEHDAGAVRSVRPMRLLATADVPALAQDGVRLVGPDQADQWHPHARGAALMLDTILDSGPADLASWEPVYGRMAEAQVKWEAMHGRSLPL